MNPIGFYRTKTGKSLHRDGCRFLTGTKSLISENTPVTRLLKPCAVCKPHVQDEEKLSKLVQHKTVMLSACGVCKAHLQENLRDLKLSREDAIKHGLAVTKTGVKFHHTSCKHAGGPGLSKAGLPQAGRQIGHKVPLVNPLAPKGRMVSLVA